jgi:hypothetical protein
MPEKIVGVILFAHAGRLPASLRVLLRSLFPGVHIEQSDCTSALLEKLTARQPCLVLMDADLLLINDFPFWSSIFQKYPRHTYFLLTHHSQQNEQLQTAGLPTLSWDGMTAASLAENVRSFINKNALITG